MSDIKTIETENACPRECRPVLFPIGFRIDRDYHSCRALCAPFPALP